MTRATAVKTRAAVATVAVGLFVAGCGGGKSSSTTTTGSLGSPGDPAKATRTVDIQATDALRFQPDQVQVKVGETITFAVTDTGKMPHDFVLGGDAAQSQHEKEMRDMSSSGSMTAMKDDPNAIHLAPGETKQVTWTFDKAGTTLFGCHEAGHYAAGMKGTITVS